MVVRIVTAAASLTLIACSANGRNTEQELLARTWAPTTRACGSDFLRITPTALEVHHLGRPTTAIQVFNIVTVEGYPNNVMVVVGPNEPGSANSVPENE